ncbi:DUF418 domain-containing protein [Pigmentiphaga aceris]|uniref:DUF418 domain-containing protein n=1 Tax=Pigmentiphaga aceris TaxID=1940612 RepID=A0A5C0B2V6_9BURK|nr:heparan-alpha-glucosaminide N-acetyltransferase domain-containing protein [Pigmentiphaga aceris]QEI08053.1 DUF418 domain-containing protein [Pigmentiphaga aceris]
MTSSTARLDGLDLARYLALAGMVLVNFRLAMQPATKGPLWLEGLFGFLEGKASATFVVLAGLGVSLATRAQVPVLARIWMLRRALFLLGVGMLNLLIFSADIIHYYAVYFLLAVPLLHARLAVLLAAMSAVALTSWLALLYLDYNQGWNWTALLYTDLWTPTGFMRNLLFNGFHPVLPWLALFLFGMLLARLPLQRAGTQWILLVVGLLMAALASMLARWYQPSGLAWLLGTAPLPPGPFYLLMGMGSASFTIGLCLRVASAWPSGRWHFLLPAGRMTLSLYLAHIVIGMGIMEATGALDGSRSLTDAMLAACAFLTLATLAAWAWSLKLKQGPIEMVMRRLTAVHQRDVTAPG